MTSIAAKPSVGQRRNRWQHTYVLGLLVTDAVVVAAAVFSAQYVRFGLSPNFESQASKPLTGFSVLFTLLWLSALTIFRTRSHRIVGGGIEEYRRVVGASFWTFGAIAIVTLLLQLEMARGYLAVAFPAGTLGLLLGRYVWRIRLSRARARGHCVNGVLAIGNIDAVTWMATELTRNPACGYRVVGFGIPGYGEPCGETITINGEEVPVLGDEVRAIASVADCSADTVVITDTEHFGVRGIRALTWQLESMDVDLVVSPGVMDIAEARLVMRPVANFPLIHVEKPQYHGAARFAKRAFDFCFALTALIVMSPLLLVAAAAIKLTSRGPVFYRAERIGLDGKPFTMLKFRTMVEDADKQLQTLVDRNEFEGGVLFKMRDDPRVTPVGRWLRRCSMDELPQFINVLKQDMSVVGPRPPLRSEVENYDGDVRRRLLVKPGITGLWQVSGRSNLSWAESVRLDLSYVENWSMIGDLLIILKTVGAVFGREGAY
ncbi:sugar transferase [Mycobacterium sp. MYCO198283]|uniref:sugar transferase n=1 Tax=Mycobacterium sp. MYCO198283 TaxID=2883505 RepID=UPI001E30B1FE|nr:sugar transferase [Mycobacterium sp. MYCO198283]MCG5431654.1 sugar transferase [Mycobacterium sp. MYCO198283]